MKTSLLNKSDIGALLKKAAKEWKIYRPPEDIPISPKDLFFPQLESLFEIKDDKIKETTEGSKKLLFGIRPCDLKGILFVDDFFRRDFEDKYYMSRIKDRLIVVEGCLNPPRLNECFCTSTKTGPFLEEGYDVQLVDIGDSYVLEIGTEKGENFISKYKNFFKKDTKSYKEKVLSVKKKAMNSIRLKVDFAKALKVIKHRVPEELYEKIAQRCIHCGGCLYVCPTCTCFNVFDDIGDKKVIRYRNWDTCVFEGFTREASRFNPRPTKWLRASRRYEHKLWYDYKVTGKSGCIGCGRCLASCPVNLGMSNFIKELTE